MGRGAPHVQPTVCFFHVFLLPSSTGYLLNFILPMLRPVIPKILPPKYSWLWTLPDGHLVIGSGDTCPSDVHKITCLDLSSCFFLFGAAFFLRFCWCVGWCLFSIYCPGIKEREWASNDLELTPRSFDHMFSNHVTSSSWLPPPPQKR